MSVGVEISACLKIGVDVDGDAVSVEVDVIDGKVAAGTVALHPIKRSPMKNEINGRFITGQDSINVLCYYPVPIILESAGFACLT